MYPASSFVSTYLNAMNQFIIIGSAGTHSTSLLRVWSRRHQLSPALYNGSSRPLATLLSSHWRDQLGAGEE